MKTLLFLAVALVPITMRAQSQQCILGNATLNGSYVTKATGFAGGSPPRCRWHHHVRWEGELSVHGNGKCERDDLPGGRPGYLYREPRLYRVSDLRTGLCSL
jgi:hypothetical protein